MLRAFALPVAVMAAGLFQPASAQTGTDNAITVGRKMNEVTDSGAFKNRFSDFMALATAATGNAYNRTLMNGKELLYQNADSSWSMASITVGPALEAKLKALNDLDPIKDVAVFDKKAAELTNSLQPMSSWSELRILNQIGSDGSFTSDYATLDEALEASRGGSFNQRLRDNPELVVYAPGTPKPYRLYGGDMSPVMQAITAFQASNGSAPIQQSAAIPDFSNRLLGLLAQMGGKDANGLKLIPLGVAFAGGAGTKSPFVPIEAHDSGSPLIGGRVHDVYFKIGSKNPDAGNGFATQEAAETMAATIDIHRNVPKAIVEQGGHFYVYRLPTPWGDRSLTSSEQDDVEVTLANANLSPGFSIKSIIFGRDSYATRRTVFPPARPRNSPVTITASNGVQAMKVVDAANGKTVYGVKNLAIDNAQYSMLLSGVNSSAVITFTQERDGAYIQLNTTLVFLFLDKATEVKFTGARLQNGKPMQALFQNQFQDNVSGRAQITEGAISIDPAQFAGIDPAADIIVNLSWDDPAKNEAPFIVTIPRKTWDGLMDLLENRR